MTTSLELAYDAAMASYEHVMDRMNALNALMDQWFVVSWSLLPLVPLTILASDRSATLESPGFAVGAAGLALVAAAYVSARLRGRAIPISPSALMGDEWLSLDADEFRRYMIEWRSEHFEGMSRHVDWKRRATYAMLAGLAVEAGGLAWWALDQILSATPSA